MAAPTVPVGYTRYHTHPNLAVDAAGSIFQGQTIESGQLVDLPDTMFSSEGYPVQIGQYITGYMTNSIDGVHSINEWSPSTDLYPSRNVTITNGAATGYQIDTIKSMYYPINAGGAILTNDVNSFDTVEDIQTYLNGAVGMPMTRYAAIPIIDFIDVT